MLKPKETLTAIIVDDKKDERDHIISLLNTNFPEVRVVDQCCSPEKIEQLVLENDPDLLFIDIKVKTTSIFDVLNYDIVKNTNVVFVTAYEEYALEGYDFDCMDYILKPVTTAKLTNFFTEFLKKAS